MRRERQEEYEWFFRATYPSVLRAVVLITRDHARGEEICQEAFIALLERWGAVVDYDHPEAWVRKVAVRKALRTATRDRRRAVLELVGRGGSEEWSSPAWPDVDLARALGELPPKQRAAVVLYYLEDMPVGEVARMLEVTESTIKQHLFRARHRLAALLDEEVVERVD